MSKKPKGMNFTIKPLIHIKDQPPGFMFSQSGKSLNKNQNTINLIKQSTGTKTNARTTSFIGVSQKAEMQKNKNFDGLQSNAIDSTQNEGHVRDCYRKVEKKKNNNENNDKDSDDKVGNLKDKDRALFCLECDDKFKGFRPLKYMNDKNSAPPVGTYTPRYNLKYKRVDNVLNFSSPNKENELIIYHNNKNDNTEHDESRFDSYSPHMTGYRDYDINYFCTKDNCYSNRIEEEPTNMLELETARLHTKSSVNFVKLVSRNVYPTARPLNFQCNYDSNKNLTKASDINNLAPVTLKDKTVAFDKGQGRNWDQKIRMQGRIETQPTFDLVFKTNPNFSIPKARRNMYSFIKEREINCKANHFNCDYNSINSNIISNKPRMKDFRKMTSRRGMSNVFLPANLATKSVYAD